MRHYLDEFDAPELNHNQRKDVDKAVRELVRKLDKAHLEPRIGFELEPIADIQRSSDKMKRLFPLFDPQYQSRVNADNSAALVIYRDGEPAGCCATRLLKVKGRMGPAMVSRELFFPDIRKAPSDWACDVNAPVARRIKNCDVAWTGVIHVTPEEHKIEAEEAREGQREWRLVEVMLRLLHAFVISRWPFAWMVGLCREPVMRVYGHTVYGYASSDWSVCLSDRPYYLMSSDRETAERTHLAPTIADLTRKLGLPGGVQ